MKQLLAIIGLLISVSAGAQDVNVVRNGTVTLVCPMSNSFIESAGAQDTIGLQIACKDSDTFNRYLIKAEDWTKWECDHLIGGTTAAIISYTPKLDTSKASLLVSGKAGELKVVSGYVVWEPYGYRNPKFLNNSYKPFPKSILIWDYKILDKQ